MQAVPRPPASPGALREALEQQPDSVPLRLALAQALAQAGDGLAAVAWLSDAWRLAPHAPEVLTLLAEALMSRRAYHQALVHYRTLHDTLGARDRATLLHLGFCLEHTGDVDGAVTFYREAVVREPGFLEAHIDLAGVLWRVGDFEGALAHARQAVRLSPRHPYAQRILGAALLNLNQLDEAEAALRTALQLEPGFVLAEVDLAFTLLLAGRWEEGWRRYTARWRDTARLQRPPWWQAATEWQGPAQPLAGRRLVVYGEQGFGDVLQFARWLPLLQAQGAQVHALVAPPLMSLLAHSFPDVQWVAPGQSLQADLHVALLDLPGLLGVTPDTVPSAAGYLQAPPQVMAAWRERLAPWSGRFKLGLCWSGSGAQVNNRNRATFLGLLQPLLDLPGVQGFSLQAGDAGAFTDAAPDAATLVDLTVHWTDFAQSAAMLCQLDLVITVDTAVAHLAGALGVPAWVLLPPNPDFRWLLEREDSPWYASLRLFRRSLGDDGRQRQAQAVLLALQDLLATRG